MIDLNKIKYTTKIWEALGNGGFIAANSSNSNTRLLYDNLEEYEEDYSEYFKGIGMILEHGNGYFYFSRTETKQSIENKLRQAMEWIDILDFLLTFDNTFGSGTRFNQAQVLMAINNNVDLKDKSTHLFNDSKTHEDIAEKLISKLRTFGCIEVENEVDGTLRVLDSFHYLKDLVECINITEDIDDEIS
ncbi:MAG: hypothetical protein K6G31_01230 [Paludibacteraceae bacterium]|nr:hypothetical protein [Paludibacteraceae bacterium]